MSVYIPLATKYRPQRFADVIGQDITVKIIMNGMMKNRLGAAMLFSGTRGVGKTTIARIVAKAFRCEHSTPEPCGKCESCQSFANGSQIDVIEIDAASNTGVDDVREIIESCRYKPTTGKFKIFIIDEVHMLSNSAFNALLKTLEEPPEHVKFLMATTETYKIPETILSRVLKFDLKRIETDVLAQHLSTICNQENVVANADVLTAIAKAADGSIRDSLSILDQVINISDKNEISMDDVRNILGISDESDIIDLVKLILVSNVKAAVQKFRNILTSDISCEKVANTILDYIYALTCIKSDIELPNGTIQSDLIEKLRLLAQNVSLPALTRMWQMLLRGIEEIKMCDRPEIVLEMMLIRITYASGLPDLQDIITGNNDVSSYCDGKSENKTGIDVNNIGSNATNNIDINGNETISAKIINNEMHKQGILEKTEIKTVEAEKKKEEEEETAEEQQHKQSSESLLDEALKMFPDAVIE